MQGDKRDSRDHQEVIVVMLACDKSSINSLQLCIYEMCESVGECSCRILEYHLIQNFPKGSGT